MIFPGGSLGEEALPYVLLGVSSSSQGKGIGEVGLRLARTKVVSSGNRFVATHGPPWGWKGKRILRRGWFCGDDLGDVGASHPVDPDESSKGILSVGGAVILFSIAESGTSSPTVMGMGCGVAAQYFEPK